jgi:ABC-2 type transport system permease protein
VGGPALGFLWKNLIATGQIFNLRLLLILVLIMSSAGSMSALTRYSSASPWIIVLGTMALMALVMSILIGPQLLRQDFRQDLPMTDILKTYPMAGWQVALGELFAPMAILTCVQWLLIIFCVGTSATFGPIHISQSLRLGIAAGVAIIAPGLNFVTLIIPNAAVLLFPGWFQTGKDAPQGIEATGQRLIFALGQLVVFILALAPAALVFAVIFYIFKITTGMEHLALPVAAVGALVVLAGEAALGLLMLGKLFERFDVAGDGAT